LPDTLLISMKGHDVSFDRRSLTFADQMDQGRDDKTWVGVSADDVAVLGLRCTRPPCSTRESELFRVAAGPLE
jgi:hypothetical protein